MRRASLIQSLVLFIAGCGAASPGGKAPPPATAATPAAVTSAAAPAPADELGQLLPVDKRIRTGKLANGLTYYVLPHKKPAARANLWLAVNAGAVLEDEDQRGLAHFVEHMGFNGTKRFPKQALVNFLETNGMRFGPDLNAYTSFDETVYMLQVPTDKADMMNTAFNILRDWADSISFDPKEVEAERGVVMEEWRLGRGAGMRIFDKQASVLFHQSKYAERLPIGKPEIIKGAPREALVRFYKDWYRPDLMALVAVGDFSADDIEARIKAEFSSLPAPATPRPRPAVPVPAHQQTLVTVETDPEMPSTGVSIFAKLPHRSEGTARDYRRMVGEQLYHAMLNARLDELRRKPDAPFLGAGSGTSNFVRTADVFTQSAAVKEDGVERAIETLLSENLRVEKHGFTKTELARAKSEMLRQYRQSVLERDKQDARQFASEIVRHFLEGEAMPGIEAEIALVERFLPTFTLEELNGMARTWGGGSQVIAVSGPATMKAPKPEALAALVKAVEGRVVGPYEDMVANSPLLGTLPKAGAVKSERTLPAIGVVEWKLHNGVRVVVKATDFKNDEVRVSALSPGGHSLVKDGEFDSARFSSRVVADGGVGTFDAVQLRKMMAGKLASVSPHIDALSEGLSGRASPEDLETLLQLIHLEFTSPRKDESAFAAWKARAIEQSRNRRLSPEASFMEDFQTFMAQNHLRSRPVTPEVVQKVDLDRAMRIYRERFADAGDFTFVFVGNVQLERLKPLVETYLGSLPTKNRKEKWRDVGMRRPSGVKTLDVVKGKEPKSMVVLAFHGPETWSREKDSDLDALGDVLDIRLREVLREDLGGVYGVGTGGVLRRRPRPEYSFSIHFGCAPENVEKLKKAVFDEIKAIQDKGIGDEYLQKVKQARVRQHELNLKENGFWEDQLARSWDFGDDPLLIPNIQPLLDRVDSARVQAAAKKYLRSSQYVLGVLKPEALPAASAAPAPAAN